MKTSSAQTRGNIYAFIAIVALSSTTMCWLVWHYPVGTAIATVAVLSALGISARLARSLDSEGTPELQHGKQGA